MHFSDDELSHLRPYVVKQLETVSEADDGILADYVLELIKSDGDEATVQRNAKEQLTEFLEGSDAFVDRLFHAIRTKEYDPSAAQASRQPDTQSGDSRKRSFRDDEDVAMQDSGYTERDRPMKAARRGRGDFPRGRGGRGGGRGGMQQPQMPMLPGFDFDPSDPMAAMMALQQAMASGVMPFPQQQQQRKPTGKRCRDYDNKGVCLRGADCRYDHGDDFQTNDDGQGRGYHSTRGRGRGRGDRGRGGRAEFSSAGPSHDRNNTRIVVESIPPEHLNEDSIRAFFSEFGQLDSIDLQEPRKLAILAFSDHDAAQRAYDSPKVIFDNRFVKVYWHKPAHSAASRPPPQDVEMPDPAVFAAQQAAAQERFEAQRAARAARDELDAKIKAQAAEHAAMLKRLAEKTGENPSNQTEALKAKLTALEAEARSMGLNPDAPPTRGRGRGRGGFAPRGRGARVQGAAVKRLDNRPRAVALSFNESYDAAKEEAVRQFLLFSDQIQHSRLSLRNGTALIAFRERFRAEMFVNAVAKAGGELPHLGKVEVAWVPNAEVGDGQWPGEEHEEGQTPMSWAATDEGNKTEEAPAPAARGEMDYDVADDDARWMVE